MHAGSQYIPLEAPQTKLERLQDKRDSLDKELKRHKGNLDSYLDATFIGAIILKDKVGTIDELMRSAQLVDLPRAADREAKVRQSVRGSAYHLVEKNNLAPWVISNTLGTMEKTRQLEYFRKAGLPNDEYVILVEVHYYRNRPVSSTKLHKDTKGETLFVNLSFTNKKAVLGPEYIAHPASKAIYDQFVSQNLPEVFVDDLEAVRRNFKGKRIIEATVLEANGVVAFVDEAIHHKTPTPGPRTASAAGLREALDYVYQDEYKDSIKAYGRYEAHRRRLRRPRPRPATAGLYRLRVGPRIRRAPRRGLGSSCIRSWRLWRRTRRNSTASNSRSGSPVTSLIAPT